MPAEPHVLHVFSSAGLYGAEHAVLGLIPALARLGIDSTIACLDNPRLQRQPLYERARALDIAAVRIPCAGRFDGTTTRVLRQHIQRHLGIVLHVHGYKSAFYALLARRTRPDTPIISTLHGWVTNTRALWLYRLLELRMLRRIQQVCIVAESMRQPLCDAGIPGERIHLVENGIDTGRFRTGDAEAGRDRLGIPREAFVFGSMLRLSAEKNPLGLVDGFARVARTAQQARLLIVGDGPQRAEVERRIHELNIQARVHLLGARDDPERLYPLFDCFVLPSLTEGLPLALLEAMACERPVIASNVGQIATVLEDLPAQLVPAGDIAALTTAMQASMRRRPPVPVLRQRVEARYSVIRMAREYAAIYRDMVQPYGHLAA